MKDVKIVPYVNLHPKEATLAMPKSDRKS